MSIFFNTASSKLIQPIITFQDIAETPYFIIGLILIVLSLTTTLTLSVRYLTRAFIAQRRSALGWSLLIVNVTSFVSTFAETLNTYVTNSVAMTTIRIWCWLITAMQLNLLSIDIMQVYSLVLGLEPLYARIGIVKIAAFGIHIAINALLYSSSLFDFNPDLNKIALTMSGVYTIFVSLFSTIMNIVIVTTFQKRFRHAIQTPPATKPKLVQNWLTRLFKADPQINVKSRKAISLVTKPYKIHTHQTLVTLAASSIILSIGSLAGLIVMQYSLSTTGDRKSMLMIVHMHQVSLGLFCLYTAGQTYLFEMIKHTHESIALGTGMNHGLANISGSSGMESAVGSYTSGGLHRGVVNSTTGISIAGILLRPSESHPIHSSKRRAPIDEFLRDTRSISTEASLSSSINKPQAITTNTSSKSSSSEVVMGSLRSNGAIPTNGLIGIPFSASRTRIVSSDYVENHILPSGGEQPTLISKTLACSHSIGQAELSTSSVFVSLNAKLPSLEFKNIVELPGTSLGNLEPPDTILAQRSRPRSSSCGSKPHSKTSIDFNSNGKIFHDLNNTLDDGHLKALPK
ncbi:hypothetical protein QVD99_000363 [Batrachochytrium dendrobatidis]|nr:hypothetical protein O5D80_007936 [Batrachochytrium dendrobatidis]KAK5672876.1 hypothetical protein QVD99_000363 [Batrachochytrium dendrobatidis]OAJ38986.1 hypothetical protein BDEG_22874 [Batrachochytrium dendrobatidis JEL423]